MSSGRRVKSGQRRGLQTIQITFTGGGLRQKMFGDLQRRRRPLVDESLIGKDVVKRLAQSRDRGGIVGLARGHTRLLFDACCNNVTSDSPHARQSRAKRWVPMVNWENAILTFEQPI